MLTFLPRALHAKAVEHDNGVRDCAIFSHVLQGHLPVPRVLPLCNGVVRSTRTSIESRLNIMDRLCSTTVNLSNMYSDTRKDVPNHIHPLRRLLELKVEGG